MDMKKKDKTRKPMALSSYSIILSIFFVTQEETELTITWCQKSISVNAQQEIIVSCAQRGTFLYSYSRPFVIMRPDKGRKLSTAVQRAVNERHGNKEIK